MSDANDAVDRDRNESSPVSFGPAGLADFAALSALFERAESACYCRYWHYAGDKNGWLDRLAHAPAENARELGEELASDAGRPHGIVARRAARIVGWMKLTSVSRLAKLYSTRPYKNLDCFAGERSGVLAVGCFLIDPSERRRGIALGLLRAGMEEAVRQGARAIEAFPRRGEHLGDAELWMGPLSIFEAVGFETVNDLTPYPVLRLTLRSE